MPNRFTAEVLGRNLVEMERLRDGALAVEQALAGTIQCVHPGWRASASNLAHYLALRNFDLRDLQRRLEALGLSSLGRAEAHTLASIDVVLATLARMAGRPGALPLDLPVDFAGGPARLEAHTRDLLGPLPVGRSTHVMVTMPTEAADDAALVRALVEAGMDCARINAAHDGPEVWERIAGNVRSAAQAVGRPCRLLVDLSGPKLRTASFPEGPRVLHLKPERGPRGEVVRSARVLLVGEGVPLEPLERRMPAHDARLPLAGPALEGAAVGDKLCLHDLRRRRRELTLVAAGPGWRLCELSEGLWVESGLEVVLAGAGGRLASARVGVLPAVETPLVLRRGDHLWLVPEDVPARPASSLGPARVGCTLPEVFRDARAGEPIHFDDGKIGGVIRAVVGASAGGPRLEIEITDCAPAGSKLRGGKGINMPCTRLALPALTAADREALAHAARYADMVGLSFVREPADVLELEHGLAALGRQDVGIVLKIETASAFRNLPRLILTGMRSRHLGVMVARGDLGVELGFERLAEVQEEILWMCEAAHVPVIWATQVLENLAKSGHPSRAEVTDAAMSARAECVMLNKGPYVLEAVRFLDDVLHRMRGHQQKKFSVMRRLSVCDLADEVLCALPAADRMRHDESQRALHAGEPEARPAPSPALESTFTTGAVPGCPSSPP